MKSERLTPYLLLFPSFIFIFFMMIYPTFYSLYLAVYDITGYSRGGFVGLNNFISILTSPTFLESLSVTFKFVIVAMIVELILGLSIAVLLNGINFGVKIIRTLLLFPMMATPVVVSLIARLFLTPEYGVINTVLESFGLPLQRWLIDSNVAIYALVGVDVWEFTPYVTLILLAGLKSIRLELYEASAIDGASRVQTFTYITLPLILPHILIANIFNLMRLIKTYDLVYMLTAGGPGRSTSIISFFIEQMAVPHMRLSEAAAATWVLLVFVLIISSIYVIYIRRSFIV